MTKSKHIMVLRTWVIVVTALSMSLLWSVTANAQDEGPGTVCILQVSATGDVTTVIVDDTRDIDIAVPAGRDNVTNVPIKCEDLDRIGIAVANQEPFIVTFTTSIYTNKGEPKCTKGPFNLQVNGGRGVSFQECL
jgi:hypothetical protein